MQPACPGEAALQAFLVRQYLVGKDLSSTWLYCTQGVKTKASLQESQHESDIPRQLRSAVRQALFLHSVTLHLSQVVFRISCAACRRQVSRDKATNIGRAISNVSSAVIFGGIFWRMGASQSSIQDRMGLLQACCTLSAHLLVELYLHARDHLLSSQCALHHYYRTGKINIVLLQWHCLSSSHALCGCSLW